MIDFLENADTTSSPTFPDGMISNDMIIGNHWVALVL